MSNSELCRIFKEIFLIADESEIYAASLENTKGWDSFSHMRLIVEVEEQFNTGPIPPQLIAKLTSFTAFSEYIKAVNRGATP